MKTLGVHKVTKAGPLLEYLYEYLAPFKKTKIKQILKFGSVRVNGNIVTYNARHLKIGDTLEILTPKEATAETLRYRLDSRVVFEDENMIVVEKEAGMLTMGTEKEKYDTVYFQLTEYERAKSKDGRGRIHIVHRLDRDASGLVVFAKNEKTKRTLQDNWEGAVKKYYAIVEGVPREKEGIIRSYLVEDKFRRVYSIEKPARDAKHAITHYRVIDTNGKYSLLDVGLETGRKNQIRVHLFDLGHPIIGDEKYGSRENPIERLALHAYHLSFPHPESGRLITFHSKLPRPFELLLKR